MTIDILLCIGLVAIVWGLWSSNRPSSYHSFDIIDAIRADETQYLRTQILNLESQIRNDSTEIEVQEKLNTIELTNMRRYCEGNVDRMQDLLELMMVRNEDLEGRRELLAVYKLELDAYKDRWENRECNKV